MLNTESYEFMNGPSNKNGFTVWLHDVADGTFDLEDSFTLAPGLSTFVNVETDIVSLHKSTSCCIKVIP